VKKQVLAWCKKEFTDIQHGNSLGAHVLLSGCLGGPMLKTTHDLQKNHHVKQPPRKNLKSFIYIRYDIHIVIYPFLLLLNSPAA
jgi:hypothetical protein